MEKRGEGMGAQPERFMHNNTRSDSNAEEIILAC